MTHPNADRVVESARDAGIEIRPVEYPAGTKTAADAAAAVGCDVAQITKSLVFRVDDELVMALTAGSNRVDRDVLARLAGATVCTQADPDAVRAATGYPIGGVPPFGHANALRSWVDPTLLGFDTVWAAAGTPRHVFPIASDDLVRLSGATPAEFTE